MGSTRGEEDPLRCELLFVAGMPFRLATSSQSRPGARQLLAPSHPSHNVSEVSHPLSDQPCILSLSNRTFGACADTRIKAIEPRQQYAEDEDEGANPNHTMLHSVGTFTLVAPRCRVRFLPPTASYASTVLVASAVSCAVRRPAVQPSGTPTIFLLSLVILRSFRLGSGR